MTAASAHPRIRALSQPPIPLVQSWIGAYCGGLGPLLDLSQAVPDFIPHPALMQRLGQAAADPQYFGYGPIAGESALREAYACHVATRYGGELSPEHTQMTSGCNQAFMAAMMALVGPGDKVLMCNPCYFNHQTSLAMLGVDVGYIRCSDTDSFLPTLASVEQAIDANTRIVLLTSPNNPTGAVYPPALLLEILQVCQSRGLWLVIDETYRDFLSEPEALPHGLFQQANWGENFIQLYSFSKSFCIPGHRLGAVVASPSIVQEIGKVMDNLQICAPRAAQQAVAASLDELSEWRESNRQEIQARAEALKSLMQQVPDWKLSASGAYFAFVRHPFEADSVAVAKGLAEQCGVICLPGEFFGEGNGQFLRFAFANVDKEVLRDLPVRLKALEGIFPRCA
ncbi:MAG: aminotransferase [Granulosicoccaceae bacterium]